MAEKLQSGYPGSEIETTTENKILLNFIKEMWLLEDEFAVDKIDWGAHPSRTTKAITINTYRVFSNIRDKDVGSYVYYFDVPVAVDVYVRDVKAEGQKNVPSPKIIKLENHIREIILANRMALRSKGINNIMLTNPVYPQEPQEGDLQRVWYHLVMEVRMVYHMFRVPV